MQCWSEAKDVAVGMACWVEVFECSVGVKRRMWQGVAGRIGRGRGEGLCGEGRGLVKHTSPRVGAIAHAFHGPALMRQVLYRLY